MVHRGILYGVPAFDPNTNAIYFATYTNSPDGTFTRGPIALQANTGCLLSPYWNAPLGTNVPVGNDLPTPATVANGVVWLSYTIADDTGQELWNSGTMFSSSDYPGPPMIANGQVFVVSSKGRLMAFGL